MQSARRNKQICYSGVFKRHQRSWSSKTILKNYTETEQQEPTQEKSLTTNLHPLPRKKRLSGMTTSNPWRKQETARKEQPSKINIKTSRATNKPPISPTSHQLYVFWCFLWVVANSSTACDVPVLAENWRKTSSSQHPARGGKPSANVSKPGADESCRHAWKSQLNLRKSHKVMPKGLPQ